MKMKLGLWHLVLTWGKIKKINFFLKDNGSNFRAEKWHWQETKRIKVMIGAASGSSAATDKTIRTETRTGSSIYNTPTSISSLVPIIKTPTDPSSTRRPLSQVKLHSVGLLSCDTPLSQSHTSPGQRWMTPRWWCRTWGWSPWLLGSRPWWWCGNVPDPPCPGITKEEQQQLEMFLWTHYRLDGKQTFRSADSLTGHLSSFHTCQTFGRRSVFF